MKDSFADYISTLDRFISGSLAGDISELDTQATFDELALRLFSLQYRHVEPYKRLCESRRVTPSNVEDWNRIPTVSTVAFREFPMTSLPPERRPFVFHSSGSTQRNPCRHFHDEESIRIYKNSLLPWFERHLLPDAPAPRGLLALTPPAASAPHSSLVHMFETVRRNFDWTSTVFCGVIDDGGTWQLDSVRCLGTIENAVESELSLVILGTAFNFVHLIDLLTQRRLCLQLPMGSRIMETGGYKGRSREMPKSQLHESIAERLGTAATQIVCEYGMCEASSQAYDHVAGAGALNSARVFRLPPWARARIVSPETGNEVAEGESGLIEIFDLANVRSVMGIQTEDIGVRRGDGFELIGRARQAEARGCSLMAQ